MLLQIAIAIFVLVLLIDVAHYVSLFGFLHKMRHKMWRVPESAAPFEPKTAVILTLRGADPFLDCCVSGLLSQDYQNFTLFLVVDHETDPALPVARRILERFQNSQTGPDCQIRVVSEHFETCSLKCGALFHVISDLDPSYEVVVTVDADTQPRSGWLRQLLEPLADPRFSVTSGLRWYIPEKATWGTLVRMLWNIAAVNQMVFSQIPWGGSLAIRREAFEKSDLLEIWKHAFTDDVSIYRALSKIGGRMLVTPSLLMINREVCSLRSFYPWMKRQVLCAKLYHPAWGLVLAQAFFLTAPLIAAFGLGIYGLCTSAGALAAWSFGALAVYIVGVLGAQVIMDGDVRRYLRQQGENIPVQTVTFVLKTMLAIALTQMVYTCAIFGVYCMKKVDWRGVWYTLGRHKTIHLVQYIPYAQVERENPKKEPSSL